MIKWETNNIILITIKPTLIEINMINKKTWKPTLPHG